MAGVLKGREGTHRRENHVKTEREVGVIAPTLQGMLRNARSQQRLAEARRDSPLQPSEPSGRTALLTP